MVPFFLMVTSHESAPVALSRPERALHSTCASCERAPSSLAGTWSRDCLLVPLSTLSDSPPELGPCQVDSPSVTHTDTSYIHIDSTSDASLPVASASSEPSCRYQSQSETGPGSGEWSLLLWLKPPCSAAAPAYQQSSSESPSLCALPVGQRSPWYTCTDTLHSEMGI